MPTRESEAGNARGEGWGGGGGGSAYIGNVDKTTSMSNVMLT